MRAGRARERVDEARERRGRPSRTRPSRSGTQSSRPIIPGAASASSHVLVEDAVGRVVGGDAVDRPVGERRAQRLDVLRLAQRRVHLARRVVAEERLVGEEQVVRRHLGRRRRSRATFASRRRRTAPARRDVRHVVPGADVLGEEDVARDDDVLGDARPAAKAEPRRDRPLVHLRAFGERVVLGVLDDRQVERRRVLERAAHDLAVRDAAPVVAHGDGAGVLQVGHLGELLALLARP